jgi:hypothetical protein
MGCGWKRWKDEVGIERLKIAQAAWQEKKSVFAKVVRGAVWCAQKSGVHTAEKKYSRVMAY